MPELPEVEHARRVLEQVAVGKRIARVRVLHPAQAKHLPPRDAARVKGKGIDSVERYGKYQLLRLSNGASMMVHFRMTGDWEVGSAATQRPAHARVVIELEDQTRLFLVDPRALSAVTVHRSGEDPLPRLGPDPLSPAFDSGWLRRTLRTRRIAIKVALLDQRIAAGVGNIYAVEALWDARIDPRAVASSLSRARVARLVEALQRVLRFASGEQRYAYGARDDFAVYDREGEPCPRCGARVRRITQAARSTYFCPRCQRR